MIPSQNGLPAPLASLEEILEGGDSSEKAVKVFVGHNLGNRTFAMLMPMHEFFGMSEVANDPARDGESLAQRKLDPAHAHKLAVYILKGLVSAAIERREVNKKPASAGLNEIMTRLGRQPYMAMQPLVVNIRSCDARGSDIRGERMQDNRSGETAAFKIYLGQKHVLWVVDGQHRRKAMQMIFEFLDSVRATGQYPKKGNIAGFGD
ncbi:MAG: DNA sulfur modification protein DndB, partial [Rhizomicrobium sp.]